MSEQLKAPITTSNKIFPCMKQVVAVRKMKGYTQQDMADKTGFPLGTIQSYETGHFMPSLDRMIMMCHVLGGDLSFTGWS